MSQRVPAALRRLVQARAHYRCEYCLIHEGDVHFPHQPDHVVAQKHRGPTHEDNLAWACYLCNPLKGSDSLPAVQSIVDAGPLATWRAVRTLFIITLATKMMFLPPENSSRTRAFGTSSPACA
ncbi:MAG: HNH endonuclease [Planctomycetes bacterium]|nr:HNH endonuclease [Planctomycetota bacterium]